MQREQEDTEVAKQAISGIESTNDQGSSSPVLEKLENKLMILLEEQTHALMEGVSRPRRMIARNSALGLAGGCATFLVSFIAVFICSADFAALLGSSRDLELSGDQVIPYLFLISTILAVLFLVWFAIRLSRKQKKVSQERSSSLLQLQEAIDEKRRLIALETAGPAGQFLEPPAGFQENEGN
jgi:hypothetical protein